MIKLLSEKYIFIVLEKLNFFLQIVDESIINVIKMIM